MRSRTLLVATIAALLGSLIGSVVAGIADTADAVGGDIPSGAVVAFGRVNCPNGWSPYTKARGRVIVGSLPEGSLGDTVGARLDDLENRKHRHTVNIPEFTSGSVGAHRHITFRFHAGEWTTGSNSSLVDWSDGVGNEGAGFFPIAMSDPYESGTRILYTSDVGAHGHSIDPPKRITTYAPTVMPYVQLTYCKKN